MDLKSLLELQKELDDLIIRTKDIKLSDRELLRSRIIAMITECGEFFNEIEEVFKYWKDSPRENKEKQIEEFSDILFFYLSISNLMGYSADDISKAYLKKYEKNIERAKGNY